MLDVSEIVEFLLSRPGIQTLTQDVYVYICPLKPNFILHNTPLHYAVTKGSIRTINAFKNLPTLNINQKYFEEVFYTYIRQFFMMLYLGVDLKSFHFC